MSEGVLSEPEVLDAENKPIVPRVRSAMQAQAMFYLWKDSARSRLAKGAIIQGMFDGNPPFRKDKRRAAGNDWQANFNTLEAASRKDSAKTPYYDLLSSNRTLFECKTKVDNETGLSAVDASGKMTELFDELLKGWTALDANLWLMLDDFIAFNKGFFWWKDEEDWRFSHLQWDRVFFPDGTSIDADTWGEFGIEHLFTVGQMWDFVKDRESAEAAGWNVDAALEAIRGAVPEWWDDNPMEIQARLNESVVEPRAMANTVQCASVYVKELDGWWSRMMVLLDRDGQVLGSGPSSRIERGSKEAERPSNVDDTGWLYSRTRLTESVQEILALFVFEVNTGAINAPEGLGKKLVPLMQMKDRLANRTADSTMMAQSTLLQETGAAASKLGTVKLGDVVSVVPQGYDVAEGKIGGNISEGLNVSTFFGQMADVNTGIYRPQFEKPAGNPESATAASIRFNQATVLTSSAVNRFNSQFDVLGVELFRRATLKNLTGSSEGLKAAGEFQKKLRESGVSREQLEDVLERRDVKSVRAIGNGSPVMRQQALSSMMPVLQFMGQRGLNNFLDDWVHKYV